MKSVLSPLLLQHISCSELSHQKKQQEIAEHKRGDHQRVNRVEPIDGVVLRLLQEEQVNFSQELGLSLENQVYLLALSLPQDHEEIDVVEDGGLEIVHHVEFPGDFPEFRLVLIPVELL